MATETGSIVAGRRRLPGRLPTSSSSKSLLTPSAPLNLPKTDSPTANPDTLLVRAIGVRQLAATIFNYTVGSGIFALPATAAAQLGAAAPLAYVACAVLMLLIVAS